MPPSQVLGERQRAGIETRLLQARLWSYHQSTAPALLPQQSQVPEQSCARALPQFMQPGVDRVVEPGCQLSPGLQRLQGQSLVVLSGWHVKVGYQKLSCAVMRDAGQKGLGSAVRQTQMQIPGSSMNLFCDFSEPQLLQLEHKNKQ